MKLIAGLGNIGVKLVNSRHNIGFMVANELVRRWEATWRPERLAFYSEAYKYGDKILIIKPTTYMNLSGQAVAHYAGYFGIMPENIAVIQDDMDLPGGKLRIKKKGSSGGHNGIKSIIAELGASDFSRFKIGIGHPINREDAVLRHVLSGFEQQEVPLINAALQKTADAVECWLIEGIEQAMNKFNGVEERTDVPMLPEMPAKERQTT